MKGKIVMNEQIELRIYLKKKLRPFVMVMSSKKKEEFFIQLHTCDIITVGPLTFLKNDLNYIVLDEH